nr:auxin-induced protein 15A-like [Ziziphus jujuba var. spinosa]
MAREQYAISDTCSIVKLKRMASMWRRLARGRHKELPPDVPPGHLAVIVGETRRRFVIRADYLNQPVFQQLLHLAYEKS